MPNVLQTVLLMLVFAGAGFVQRVSGFGLGIFAMLFLPYLTPSHTMAAAVSCLVSCGSSSYNAIKYRKHIPFKTVLPVLLAAFAVIPFAVLLSKQVSTAFFKLLLGGVLIALGIYFLCFNSRLTIKPTVPNGIIAGVLGGTLNGLFSTGGPPVVLFMTHACADNISYFAGIQFYFGLTNIYSTVCRIFSGLITWQILLTALLCFGGCMVGDAIGRRVFDRLNAKKLKQIIYIGMMVSGIVMFF